MTLDLSEWDRHVAAMTEGEWSVPDPDDGDIASEAKGWFMVYCDIIEDAEAICYLRNNAKAMSDRVRGLEEKLAGYKEPLSGRVMAYREVWDEGFAEGERGAWADGYACAVNGEGLEFAAGKESAAAMLASAHKRIAELEAEVERLRASRGEL